MNSLVIWHSSNEKKQPNKINGNVIIHHSGGDIGREIPIYLT